MQLVVQSGAEPGRTYDLTEGRKVVVGRQSGNDVVVPDEQVSRKHAEIEERTGNLVVTDLNSSNGTFVNGTRISSPQTLRPGDTVQVGTTVLKVMAATDTAATQAVNFTQPNAGVTPGEAGAYGASAGYGAASGATPAQGQYGQPSYGTPPAPGSTPDYAAGQGQYAQPNYGQSAGAPADYSSQGQYGQTAGTGGYDASYGQGQGQAGQGQAYNYATPAQPAYGAGPGQAYGQPPAATPARRGGLPLPAIIGGAAVLAAIIIGVILFIVLGGGGGGGVGDIPAPKNATKLDFSTADIEKLLAAFPQSGNKPDLSKVKTAGYSTKETAASVNAFYRDELKKKGFSEDTTRSKNEGSLYFNKGDEVATVSAIELKTQQQVDSFTSLFNNLKGKLNAGDTLVIAFGGPKSVFNTTPAA